MKRWLLMLLLLQTLAVDAQSDFGDRFFAKVEKDALRDLERGKPAKQIEAAKTLGVDHAERTAPILARHLTDSDSVNRLAAAELLWTLAASKPDAAAAAQLALRSALDDSDPAVAMNAAGALTAMDVPDLETAPARRRVLREGRAQGYVQFLAARGLIGIDPAPSLSPILVGYLFDASSAESRGESSQNREIAVQALNALVATQDRALIAPLQAELNTVHPATEYLLKAIHRFEPRPQNWTQTLLAQTRSRNDEIIETAWDLLEQQTDPLSIKAWAPLASENLSSAQWRGAALSALARVAGKTTIGLDALAALAADASVEETHRLRAIDVLGDAAEVTAPDTDAAVAKAAQMLWLNICQPVLEQAPAGDRFKACLGHLSYIYPDNKVLAPHLTLWLSKNADAEAKIVLLERIESLWGDGISATDTVKRELSHADARVVKAAEATLDRIRPAWRESAARQARTAERAPAPARPALESASGGRGADGAGLYEAVRVGNLAKVKKLVDAGNIHKPVHFPQMQGGTPTPLVVAINYCGIPTLSPAQLAAIVDYLIALGADPDGVDTHGDNLFDRAKYACPPEVMAALSR